MNQKDEHKQDLVHSLLKAMYETDKDKAHSLVASGMERLDDSPATAAKDSNSWSLRLSPRLLTLALGVVAMVFVAVALPGLDDSKRAMASVKLSLEQAFLDVGRHYTAKAVWQLPDNETRIGEADLYVKGGDKFAIRFGVPQQQVTFWIGSDEKRSWVVPPVGPVLEGDRRHLTSWFDQRDDVSTPYLHITTALEKMSNLYELQMLPDEELDLSGRSHQCQRVNAMLIRDSAHSSPDQIDLWIDDESGVALKIVATWDLAEDQIGRESATIVLKENIGLSDEFFTAEGHGGEERHRISFATE